MNVLKLLKTREGRTKLVIAGIVILIIVIFLMGVQAFLFVAGLIAVVVYFNSPKHKERNRRKEELLHERDKAYWREKGRKEAEDD